jgi:hypothetical protein
MFILFYFSVRTDALMHLCFSLGAGNANGGLMWGVGISVSLTKFPIPIFEDIMIQFGHSFFSWIGILI